MYKDFLSSVHKSTARDYLARVNDPEFPKAKASKLAKEWGYDYWDGDRRICYGGYKYMPGRWKPVAEQMIDHYNLQGGDKVLDIGCGKGFLLYEMKLLIPDLEVSGIDISTYAIENCKQELSDSLRVGNANDLPFEDNCFDYVFSINTFHNLHCFDLELALVEMNRVSKKDQYICIESYRNEIEKANLLYWQVTCEAFNNPEEWKWWFEKMGYSGDHSFIFFE